MFGAIIDKANGVADVLSCFSLEDPVSTPSFCLQNPSAKFWKCALEKDFPAQDHLDGYEDI